VQGAGGGEFADASFVSTSESWAVGDSGPAEHLNKTLIERFGGPGWPVVPSPDQGTSDNGLNGVSRRLWRGTEVGYAHRPGVYQPLALQWDRTQWPLDLPATFPSDALLTDVDTLAEGSAWAVGFQTNGRGDSAHAGGTRIGRAWTPVASPNDGTSTTAWMTAVSRPASSGTAAISGDCGS